MLDKNFSTDIYTIFKNRYFTWTYDFPISLNLGDHLKLKNN